LPFFDDFDWATDEEGPAWRKEDQAEGRPWPMVGEDEDVTAASESLGLFWDTSLFIASCMQSKTKLTVHHCC
jgi:hypothetical protein